MMRGRISMMGFTDKMNSRVRFRLWEATFCLVTLNNNQTNQDKLLLTSFRVRLAFGALLAFNELSSEAFRLPEGSEGIMERLKLVVMVEVMFIDKSGGYLSPMSRISCAVGGKASGVVCRAWMFPSNRGSTSDFQLLSHALIKQTKTHADRPPASFSTTFMCPMTHYLALRFAQ